MKYSKLGVKITVFLMLLIVSSVVIYSFVFITSERNRIKDEILTNGTTFGEFSSNTIYQNYIRYYRHNTEEDFQLFKTIVEGELEKNEDVVKIQLLGVNGRILFDSDEFDEGQYNSEEARFIENPGIEALLKSEDVENVEGELEGKTVVDVIVPINESGIGHIASVRYSISYDELSDRLTEVYKESLFTIIPVLLVCLVLNIFFSYRISEPIVQLTELTKKISAGKLDVETNIRTGDEIGALARSFESMAEEIKKSREKLESYTQDLEKQVKERTKELQENLDELKSMNRMMVDRELKMVELKKELEKYKKSADKDSTKS